MTTDDRIAPDDGSAPDDRIAPDDRSAPDDGIAPDIEERDALLGVSLRDALGPRALLGIGQISLALLILLWPEPTNRIFGLLAGVGLAWFTFLRTRNLVRSRANRTFWPILVVAICAGLTVSLLAHPDESLLSVVQFLGGVTAAWGVVCLVRLLRGRGSRVEQVSWIVGSTITATVLILYPVPIVQALSTFGALLLGGNGLIEVFHRPDAAEEPVGRGANRLFSTVETWVRRRPDLAEDRDVLQQKVIFEGPDAATRYARFAALMGFAAVIASIGVVVESTAVVIGAMLVAPLMVPLMGTALSVPMGWPRRMKRCMGVAASGIVIAVLTGAVVAAITPRPIDVTSNTEILARISPTQVDLAIAIAAGAAGAYALARRDVSDSLPGVAVAIALVPPLTVVGLCWQQGAWSEGYGALLLFSTNAVAILFAGGAMFVLVGAAPLERVSDSQRRLSTVILALVSVAAVVVLLLLLNGQELARAELSQSSVQRALADWSSEHDDWQVVDQRVTSSGTIVVDLAGPGDPPDLDQLLDELRDALGEDVVLDVRWVTQQAITIGPD